MQTTVGAVCMYVVTDWCVSITVQFLNRFYTKHPWTWTTSDRILSG